MALKGPSESEIQKAFFQWLSYYPYIRSLTMHIPNGGSRNKLEAINLKKQGVTPGWPDVFMAIPTKTHHGLFIEFKSKIGKVSTNQSSQALALMGENYAWAICRSLDEAMEIVKFYLGDKWDVKQPTISGKTLTASA
jgi:hypothetical protein